MSINTILPDELFDRMNDGCASGLGRGSPFTLILGSGFSFPIIPTTAQIVREDLPWWKWCQRNETNGPTPGDYVKRNEKPFAARVKEEAEVFWASVSRAAARISDKPPFTLGADGRPEQSTIGEAYQFALSAQCQAGLCTPAQVRHYFADLVRRIGRRLNPAHLYLAAIVAERPQLFGTLFTTNFDPLLQRALQLVNVPYFVSDRPDTMQHPDDDDVAEAIHLIYAHGSIYRYLLLNSPEQIEEYANRNQSLLQEYFRKHAVLIVGYSGWDDAITRALLKVDQFAHNLYWCDRGSSPDKCGLSKAARDILHRHANAFYVPIVGADRLMAEMHQHLLGPTLPRLFRSPIEVVQKQLRQCDLSGVKLPQKAKSTEIPAGDAADGKSSSTGRVTGGTNELDLGDEVSMILRRLENAQQLFIGGLTTESDITDRAMLAAHIREQLAIASDLYFGTNPIDAIPYFDAVMENADVLDAKERAIAWLRRGATYDERGQADDLDRAIADYSAIIDMPDAPIELRVMALLFRGGAYGKRGQADDVDREIADYSTVIDMPNASVEQHAKALFNRAVAYRERGQAGDEDLAIDDYSAVIEMSDAPVEQRAKAYINRGVAYIRRRQKGDIAREIGDYSAVIDMPDAPVEQLVTARINRGIAYNERGQAGDEDLATADFSIVIDMPDAPAEQRAKACINRAVTCGQRGQEGDMDCEIADYSAVIDMPDATSEQRALVHINRGIAYGRRGQEGDKDRAIADYNAVIDMPDAPAEQRARAESLLLEGGRQSES